MLSKEICKRCKKELFSRIFRVIIDEKNWEAGLVNCPKYNKWWIKTKDGPLKKCRYLVEQFLYHDATKEENQC